MNNIVELGLISTASTVTNGFLDLYGGEPINIKMSISDIKDISKRSAPYTQSFTLPGTKNNNEMLNHIFNIGSDASYDARKKSGAYLAVDSIPVMSNGVFQLTGIAVDENKKIDYQGTIFSESQDLFGIIGDDELTDLDFTDLNHTYYYPNMTESWTGGTTKFFYPLIDYSYDFNLTDMNIGMGVRLTQMFPATQVKVIFDKIISGAGFSYNSTFLNSNYFKSLYVPFNGSKLVQSPTFITNRSFQAGMTADVSENWNYSNLGFHVSITTPLFNDDSTTPNFDNGGLYNNATYIYTANAIANIQFEFNLDIEYTSSNVNTFPTNAQTIINCFRSGWNGGTVPYSVLNMIPTFGLGRTQQHFASNQLNGPPNTIYGPSTAGETFWFTYVHQENYNGALGQTITYTIHKDNSYCWNKVNNDLFINSFLDYSVIVPKKIKQKDFLNSIIYMHNLYLDPNKDNAKNILIEPRDAYYSAGTRIKDWTSKLDLKAKIDEKLISEQQNKRIVFTYKQDKDVYNEIYKTAKNRIYGDEYFTIDNDFIAGEKKIEVIFSPTPDVSVLNSSTSNTQYANEFVIPNIQTAGSNSYGKTEHNIRILQKNAAGLVNLDGADSWKLEGVVQTKYPYLGMLDHPSTGTTDLGFGTVDDVFYTLNSITNNNLVNRYWRTYLEQIGDKDSRIINCNIYLTPQDIQDFKFSDSIFIDGLTEDGGHYFIVNSIEYSPTTIASSKVELIKVKEKFVSITTPVTNTHSWNNGTILSEVVQIGGAKVDATGVIASGPEVYISAGSNRSIAIGEELNIGSYSPRSMIIGSGSTIPSGLKSCMVFGDNISATTADTVFVPNLRISPGGTINGSAIESITGSSILWSSGSGVNSIIQNNSSGNTATGDSSFVVGSNNSAATIFTSVLGGQSNLASGTFSSVIGGGSNSATNQSSGVFVGGSNWVSGQASAIIGGSSNATSGSNTVILGGSNITGNTNDTVYVPNLAIQSQHKIFVATGGTNPTAGIATLASGSSTVLTTSVTANSFIMLTPQGAGITFGDIGVDSRTGSTAFKITSSSGADNRSVAWILFEPF